MLSHKSTRTQRDFTAEATELFARFAATHDLSFVAIDEGPIEALWKFPIQQKLRHPVVLGLQNGDELNFGVGDFWSYFFPFSKISEEFLDIINAWVDGRARVVSKPGFVFHTLELQVRRGGEWEKAYSAGSISIRRRHPVILTNRAEIEAPC